MKLAAQIYLILLFFGVAKAQEPTPTPVQIREEVVVTANRIETRIGDTPASVVTFSRSEIESAAAATLDDILRQSAGFSIFRRSSSRNANPTTQGVSLRGVGSSGASRSVVIFDGVPLNDPFGGWVQWGRVPPVAVETVEVLRGGASSLYGDAGLSGAVNLLPRKVEGKYTAAFDLFGGTQKTIAGSGFAGLDLHGWHLDAVAHSFQTKGYKPVDEQERGPIDSFAGTRSSGFSVRLSRDLGKFFSLFARPSYFGEVRSNGTGLQTNRTHIRQIVVGGNAGRRATVREGFFSRLNINWRAYHGTQVFDQTFSAVNAARTSESLTRIQRVPATNSGFSVQLTAVYKDHTFLGGVDLRNVRGSSDEVAFANNASTALLSAGGRENTAGVFAQDFIKISDRVVAAVSIRYDRWRNFSGSSVSRQLATNQRVTTTFPSREEDAFSPQFSILYHLSDEVSVYTNASRSFRAPTLNELYRSFRVGSVMTIANENLRAERATNVEGGIAFRRKRVTLRTNAFWTKIDDPVVNLTLSISPALITRQRQNAGQTRSRGVEIEIEGRLKSLDLSGGYLFADSSITKFPSDTRLIGLRIPQVARHQFTAQMRLIHNKWTFALQGRASSEQFDDDLNLFRLEPYAQIDLFIAKRINERAEFYASVENIFNSRYSVGKTPVRTVSSPTIFRAGFRWK